MRNRSTVPLNMADTRTLYCFLGTDFLLLGLGLVLLDTTNGRCNISNSIERWPSLICNLDVPIDHASPVSYAIGPCYNSQLEYLVISDSSRLYTLGRCAARLSCMIPHSRSYSRQCSLLPFAALDRPEDTLTSRKTYDSCDRIRRHLQRCICTEVTGHRHNTNTPRRVILGFM